MNAKKFGIEIELDFFEVGEGKSDLDRHFGAAKQSVRRRVKHGKSLNGSLSELLTAVSESVKNTSIYEIRPERKEKEEFYKSYRGTNPVRSVRLITEEVGGIVKEKRMDLVGSLASGYQFFRYDFGEGEAVARKKNNKPSQATNSSTSSSSLLPEVSSESSSSSSSSPSTETLCLLCGNPCNNKSKKHRSCIIEAKKERVSSCMMT